MLKARIIPCLDVEGGRVVKGVNFVDLIDAGDPVEQARIYDNAGADELTFLDITASHEYRDTIFDVVSRTAEQCFMPLTVGGGVVKRERFEKYYPGQASFWTKTMAASSCCARRPIARAASCPPTACPH